MSKYQEIIYGSGLVYGEASKVAFSAEPVEAVAISHSAIQVTWAKPINTELASYVGFRIVRNQDAFPENEEDGAILYEFYTRSAGVIDRTSFIDGEEQISGLANAPLVSGRFAYYRAWILLDATGEWVRAGDAYTLLPSPHYSGTGPDTVVSEWSTEFGEVGDATLGNQNLTTTHDRMMSLIPRVYLSANQGPLDAIREYDPAVDDAGPSDNVLLNQFLKGFSLTADEFLDYAEFITPDISGRNTAPNILKLQSHQLNLSFDTAGISRTQKKMVREAIYTYRRKGTLSGLQTAIEALTGYDVVLTESPNLMLSPQDSTFYRGTGFWNAETGTTIKASIGVHSVPTSTYAIDTDWCAEVDVTTSGSISNGILSPITRGIPVKAGTEYEFDFWANLASYSSGKKVTPSIYWFDKSGKQIGSPSVGTQDTLANIGFSIHTLRATAPAKAVYAGVRISFDGTATYLIDMVSFKENTYDTSFYEARGVHIKLNPKKTNYLMDPSFEGDLSSWTIHAASYSAVSLVSGGVYDGPMGARAGLKKLRAVTNSSGFSVITVLDPIDPYPGMTPAMGEKFYTFSFYAKASADYGVNIAVQTNSQITQKHVTFTPEWQRFYVTTYAADAGELTLWANIVGAHTSGVTVEIDSAQLEASYYPTDYFDGSLTLSGGAWNLGTLGADAHAAASFYYPGINTKMTRLANEIEKYLPINTPYFVEYIHNDGGITPPKGIS